MACEICNNFDKLMKSILATKGEHSRIAHNEEQRTLFATPVAKDHANVECPRCMGGKIIQGTIDHSRKEIEQYHANLL